MTTNETPASSSPKPSWFGQMASGRTGPALAIAVIAAAFGGGFLTAKTTDGLSFLRPRAAVEGAASSSAHNGANGWSLFGKPRSANAPRRGPARPDGFAVWRSRIDTSRPEPQACIELSKPLDPAKSYADFVLVSPELASTPAVSVKDGELCVGGVGFADRRITLLKGLPAKTGETLDANADVDFTFGEKPPYVGFAGEGVILPREDSDGIGVETVNVSRLSIEVWRVVDRNLVRKSISAPEPTAQGDYPSDYGDDSEDGEGRRVWKGEVTVKGEAGERVTTVFPLGAVLKEMQPGAYVIKAVDASARGPKDNSDDDDNNLPAQARRWVVFTDMALSAYEGSQALDVVARSLQSAKTLGGLRVALLARNGETLAEGKTDSAGRVRFDRPLLDGEGAEDARMVMAYGPQGDLAVLDLDRAPVDLSKQGVGGRAAGGGDEETSGRKASSVVDGYLYADRGIFRPGETAHLNVLLRDHEARAIKDRKGAVVIRRPSGVEFKRIGFDKTPTGSVVVDVDLPKGAPRGRWKAVLEIDGLDGSAGEMSFSVEDFAPQRLAVTATGQEAAPVGAGEARTIDISARFLYGAAGAGLQTQGEARLRADPDPFPQFKDYKWGDQREAFEEKFLELGSTVTDGEGHAIIALSTAEAGDTAQPLEADVTTSVFEPGGRPVREGLNLKVRTKPVYLASRSTRPTRREGATR